MEMTKHPYELLLRWCEKTGELRGAHVKWCLSGVDADTGERVSHVGKAVPIEVGRAEGFPLDSLIKQGEAAAIAGWEAAVAERAEAEAAAQEAMATARRSDQALQDALESLEQERQSHADTKDAARKARAEADLAWARLAEMKQKAVG